MPVLPKGMKCTFGIAPCLVKMKYEDLDMLAYTKCTADPFDKRMGQEGDPTVRTLHEWENGLQ